MLHLGDYAQSPEEPAFCSIPGTGTRLLNPTPQAQEGGDGGRGGNQRVQVTIYGPLVNAVLSLQPAPSKKWCPLLNPRAGCPPGLGHLGTGGPAGERKDCCGEPAPPLAKSLLRMSPSRPPAQTASTGLQTGEGEAAGKK